MKPQSQHSLNDKTGAVQLGTDLHRLTRRQKTEFRAKHVGFAFQHFNLLPALTAAENVAVPLAINGVSRSEGITRAVKVLEKIGLGERIDAFPSQMSGGQQQRVTIARGMIHNPRILVCDEPTSSVDAQTGQAVMELIREIALQPDRLVIVVTHDNRIFQFADRIISMEDGRIKEVQRQNQ